MRWSNSTNMFFPKRMTWSLGWIFFGLEILTTPFKLHLRCHFTINLGETCHQKPETSSADPATVQVLLQHRAQHLKDPGTFGLVGGQLDVDEAIGYLELAQFGKEPGFHVQKTGDGEWANMMFQMVWDLFLNSSLKRGHTLNCLEVRFYKSQKRWFCASQSQLSGKSVGHHSVDHQHFIGCCWEHPTFSLQGTR